MNIHKTIEYTDVSLLTADPDQPRKHFDPLIIEELAKNISIEGIINPIEVDENNVIITGESRWRAAKKIGLKNVPTKKIEGIEPELRFRRQILENIHNETMVVEDMANALKKYLRLFGPKNKKTSNDKYYNWLATHLGKSKGWVQIQLSWFDTTDLIKNAIRKKKIGHDFLKVYFHTIPNSRLRQKFERKVISRNIHVRNVAQTVAGALRAYPEKGNEILGIDYKGTTEVDEAKRLISRVIPGYSETPVSDAIEQSLDAPKDISAAAQHLIDSLNAYKKSDIKKIHQFRVALALNTAGKKIVEWVNAEELKQLI